MATKPSPPTLWQKYCDLKDKTKFKILCFAGREATASFCIACPKGQEGETHPERQIARAALITEPFTYWDWHRKPQDHEDLSSRRLLWEREKGFSKLAGHKFPTPKESWEAFKRHVESGIYDGRFVNKIAVATWMGVEDMSWIATRLPNVKALDMSHVPIFRDGSVQEKPEDSKKHRFYHHLDQLSQAPSMMPLVDKLDLFTHLNEAQKQKMRLDLTVLNEEKEYSKLSRALTVLIKVERKHRAESQQKLSAELQEYEDEITKANLWTSIRTMFRTLKWLGIPDPREEDGLRADRSYNLLRRVVANCLELETLSIRGPYEPDETQRHVFQLHNHVCLFMANVVDHIPETVTCLELRLSIGFIGHLLHQLRERKPHVKKVGIDLGAWVQIYPLDEEALPMQYGVADRARGSALRLQHEIYEREHNKVLPKESKWYLPNSADGYSPMSRHQRQRMNKSSFDYYWDRSGSGVVDFRPFQAPEYIVDSSDEEEGEEEEEKDDEDEEEDEEEQGKNKIYNDGPHPNAVDPKVIAMSECSWAADDHDAVIDILDDEQVDTLPKMFKKLYIAQQGIEGIKLFGLEPEPRARSTDPIHPLTLIQRESVSFYKDIKGVGHAYGGFDFSDFSEIFPWLSKTFGWDPVFDWDWFMVPERMVDDANPALLSDNMKANWLNPSQPETSGLHRALTDLRFCFQKMRKSGIPLHILIGRRTFGQSSCYWGWPYDETKWLQWVKDDFSANLEVIAPLIDTLSILYDLRNPLDCDRLEEIEAAYPQDRPHALCPERVCPFENFKDCLFYADHDDKYHRRLEDRPASGEPQKMANEKELNKSTGPEDYKNLAHQFSGRPPTGENAEDHPSDDSDSDDKQQRERSPLHHLARRAAFSRESLGWQRFWQKYALSLTSMTTLDVRMPRVFDKNGSWYLAKLLGGKGGWRMTRHTDERQHIQTAEDLTNVMSSADAGDTYIRKREAPTWPAGRFIRRTWICQRYESNGSTPIPSIEQLKNHISNGVLSPKAPSCFSSRASYGNRTFSKESPEMVEKEREELAKAAARAKNATENESQSNLPPIEPLSVQDLGLAQSKHGRYHRTIASEFWRGEVRALAEELETEISKHSHEDVKRLLDGTRRGLLERAGGPVPYETIFRREREGKRKDMDDRYRRPKPYRHGIMLVSGGTWDLVEEEKRLKELDAAPFPDELGEGGGGLEETDTDDELFGIDGEGFGEGNLDAGTGTGTGTGNTYAQGIDAVGIIPTTGSEDVTKPLGDPPSDVDAAGGPQPPGPTATSPPYVFPFQPQQPQQPDKQLSSPPQPKSPLPPPSETRKPERKRPFDSSSSSSSSDSEKADPSHEEEKQKKGQSRRKTVATPTVPDTELVKPTTAELLSSPAAPAPAPEQQLSTASNPEEPSATRAGSRKRKTAPPPSTSTSPQIPTKKPRGRPAKATTTATTSAAAKSGFRGRGAVAEGEDAKYWKMTVVQIWNALKERGVEVPRGVKLKGDMIEVLKRSEEGREGGEGARKK
ncbi:hypothetical protein CC80DRAFT_531685 [Byssothecium circinans]|uniref:Uncharacterized protein n=1 Tax=Byssothecium circinans TaxID=147558 RepID=A0A6A5UAJ2_9PLEO|nr:hypothetical protein CC80DRAFT_531685 [Byssothecium circinans]